MQVASGCSENPLEKTTIRSQRKANTRHRATMRTRGQAETATAAAAQPSSPLPPSTKANSQARSRVGITTPRPKSLNTTRRISVRRHRSHTLHRLQRRPSCSCGRPHGPDPAEFHGEPSGRHGPPVAPGAARPSLASRRLCVLGAGTPLTWQSAHATKWTLCVLDADLNDVSIVATSSPQFD